MRLNKYIASSGICSRRKADSLIAGGNVKVNGASVCEMGFQVSPGDEVAVNGTPITLEKRKIYLALNKPAGYITSLRDEKGRPTVSDLVSDIPERLFPVGRLDYNTSGLIIMTNDGQFAQTLAHPSRQVPKTYVAKISGNLSRARQAMLKSGVDIGGFVTSGAELKIIKRSPGSAVVEISIREGKNRQVRKMFAAVGCRVQALERIAIGDIRLGHLKSGTYRKLRREEIDCLAQKALKE